MGNWGKTEVGNEEKYVGIYRRGVLTCMNTFMRPKMGKRGEVVNSIAKGTAGTAEERKSVILLSLTGQAPSSHLASKQ